MTHPTDEELDALVKRLNERAKEDRQIQSNNETVAVALKGQRLLFDQGFRSQANTFAVRLGLDYENCARKDAQLATDWERAAATIAALRAQLAEANARADRAEAALAAQIEVDAGEPIAWAYSHATGGYTVCDDEYEAWCGAENIGREMTVRPLYFIRNQSHDRTALDRIIADTRAEALRDAAKVCDKNEHVSGWVSRDAILAKIKGANHE